MTEKLLTVGEVATRLIVAKDTVYRLIHAGDLKAQNIGTAEKTRFRVSESAVNAFLEGRAFTKESA